MEIAARSSRSDHHRFQRFNDAKPLLQPERIPPADISDYQSA
jgi:hypothetical protein